MDSGQYEPRDLKRNISILDHENEQRGVESTGVKSKEYYRFNLSCDFKTNPLSADQSGYQRFSGSEGEIGSSPQDKDWRRKTVRLKYSESEKPPCYIHFVVEQIEETCSGRLNLHISPDIRDLRLKLQELQFEVFYKCDVMCGLVHADNRADNNEAEKFSGFSSQEIVLTSMKSQQDSKHVEAFLDRQPNEELIEVIKEAFQMLDNMTVHENGCFILTYLIRRNQVFAKVCANYCLSFIDKFFVENCAVKVMQALAEVSEEFCVVLMQHFQNHYEELVSDLNAVVLVSKAIQFCPNGTDLTFYIQLLEEAYKDFGTSHQLPPKLQHLVRLVSSLVERSKATDTGRLLQAFVPHLEWLMSDKLGNACTYKLLQQMFCTDRFEKEKARILSSIHLMYIRRYRKYALLKILKMEESVPMIEGLFDQLLLSLDSVMMILRYDASTYLLIATLLRVTDLDKLKYFLHQVERQSRITAVQYNQTHLNELLLYVERWVWFLAYYRERRQ